MIIFFFSHSLFPPSPSPPPFPPPFNWLVRRFLERYGSDICVIFVVQSEVDLIAYEAILALYFPRNEKEEREGREGLPEDVGDERGGKEGVGGRWGEGGWGGGKIRVNLTITEEEERRRVEEGERVEGGGGEVCVGGHEPEMVRFLGEMREKEHPDEGWEKGQVCYYGWGCCWWGWW